MDRKRKSAEAGKPFRIDARCRREAALLLAAGAEREAAGRGALSECGEKLRPFRFARRTNAEPPESGFAVAVPVEKAHDARVGAASQRAAERPEGFYMAGRCPFRGEQHRIVAPHEAVRADAFRQLPEGGDEASLIRQARLDGRAVGRKGPLKIIGITAEQRQMPRQRERIFVQKTRPSTVSSVSASRETCPGRKGFRTSTYPSEKRRHSQSA